MPSLESRSNKKKRGRSIIAGRKHYLSSKRKQKALLRWTNKKWILEVSQGCTCFSLHRSRSFLDLSLVTVVGSGTLFSPPGQLKLLCFTTGSFPTRLQTYTIILVSGIIFKIPALVDLWTHILHVRILGGWGRTGKYYSISILKVHMQTRKWDIHFSKELSERGCVPKGISIHHTGAPRPNGAKQS